MKWPSLGFEPVRRRTGRGKTQEPMTEWVKQNESVANLLTLPDEDPDQLEVGVDNNVFCDLYGTSAEAASAVLGHRRAAGRV